MQIHINQATIFGDVADAPKVVETNGGKLAKFTICTEKPVTKKNGDEVKIRNFHRVTVWGEERADGLAASLGEGDPVFVQGEIQYGSYEDKDGVKRYTTDINVGFDGKVMAFPQNAAVLENTENNPFN